MIVDEQVNLANLLIQLQDEVTPKWYELGEIVGVPKEILDKCSGHPSDQCIIEVLDYWLIHYYGQLTWKDVAHALKEINLHQLSEKILQIHEKRRKIQGTHALIQWRRQGGARGFISTQSIHQCTRYPCITLLYYMHCSTAAGVYLAHLTV